MYDLLIQNARLISADMDMPGDIAVKNGKIAAIGPHIAADATWDWNAHGCWLVPGGVDAHTHLNLQAGANHVCDGWGLGSAAALAGGTTSVLEHISFGSAAPADKLAANRAEAAADCLCDFGLHDVIQAEDIDDSLPNVLLAERANQVRSWKAYTTYDSPVAGDVLLQLLRATKQAGVLLTLHCEDDRLVQASRDALAQAGQLGPQYHAASRPAEAEAVAVKQAIDLAHQAGDAPLYIVHLSTAAAMEAVRQARANGQQNLYVETCPQYLFLDESRYQAADALGYVLSPPLRKQADADALWQAINAGENDVVATDHCAFTMEQKQAHAEDLRRIPNGAPGVNERLALMLSAAAAGLLRPERAVELCCSSPARIFGLANKGRLEVGADADLALFDPAWQGERQLVPGQPYSNYLRPAWNGLVIASWRRGELAWDGTRFTIHSPGELIRREQ